MPGFANAARGFALGQGFKPLFGNALSLCPGWLQFEISLRDGRTLALFSCQAIETISG
jgi:hypothetical protein